MDATTYLLIAGVFCVIAAIVGGNLKLPGTEVGPIQSRSLRIILAIVGMVLVGYSVRPGPHPLTKEEYLANLDTICGKKNSSIASWISFTSNPNPIDRINLIINAERNFLAQWRRLPAPQGDEERLTSILDKFDQYISSYEKGKDVYLAALQRGEYPDYANDVLIAKQNISDAITEYNAAIRGYGSNRCSVPSIP